MKINFIKEGLLSAEGACLTYSTSENPIRKEKCKFNIMLTIYD